MPYKDINEGYIDQGWQQMRALLDREMPVGPVVPVWRKWPVLVLLFFLFTLPVSVDTHRSPAKDEQLDGFPIPLEDTRQEGLVMKVGSEGTEPASESLSEEKGTRGKEKEGEITIAVAAHSIPSEAKKERMEVLPGGNREKRLSKPGDYAAKTKVRDEASSEAGLSRSSLQSDPTFSSPRMSALRLLEIAPPGLMKKYPLDLPDRIPYASAASGNRWSFGMAGGLGLAIAQGRPQFWLGWEGEYRLHRKWSLWSRLAYQWNTFGPETTSGDDEAALDGSSFDPELEHQSNRTFYYRQQPEELAAHRIGLLVGAVFRPHRAIRLETGFQWNYLSTYTYADQRPPSLSFGPSQSIQLEERKLDIRTWEPILHLGFYWRVRPAFQLGATWQQTLAEMSRTESYSLRPRQLSLSFRWRLLK